MRSRRSLADSLLATKERWRDNKKALEPQGHFCHVGRLPQVVQSHFFKMTSRTAPLLSDKEADEGQLAHTQKLPHKIILSIPIQKATISRPVLSEFSSEPV